MIKHEFAVIFDSDGVLIDSEKIALDGIVLTAEQFGIDLSQIDMRFCFGMATQDFLIFLNTHFKRNIGFEDDFMPKNLNNYKLLAKDRLRIFEGVADLINDLKKNDTPIAVASSAQRGRIDFNYEILGLKDTFDIIVSGSDVEKGKPDPAIFLKTAEKLGIEPNRCIVVEDSINGILGAKNAGMLCVAITNTFPKDELAKANPDLIIDNIKELSYKSLKDIMSESVNVS